MHRRAQAAHGKIPELYSTREGRKPVLLVTGEVEPLPSAGRSGRGNGMLKDGKCGPKSQPACEMPDLGHADGSGA